MYTDLMDSVSTTHTSANENFIRAESFLFDTLLNGNRPTLSTSQALDSMAILNLVENPKTSTFFLKAIEKGYIRIALYGSSNSLQGYLLQTLHNITEETSPTFRFSSMPFLYEKDKYTYQDQLAIYHGLVEQLSTASSFIKAPLYKEDKEKLEHYVELVRLLNTALNKTQINNQIYRFSKAPSLQLSTELKLLIEKKLVHEESEEKYDLLQLLYNNCCFERRTDYYNLLDSAESSFSQDALEEARKMIDLVYNQVVASSIQDNESTSLHIPNKFSNLVGVATDTNQTSGIAIQELIINPQATDYMSWDRLIDTLPEIECILHEKQCTWDLALQTYITKQRYTPLKLGAKYVGITALTCLISSIPLVGSMVSDLVTNVVWSSACDVLGEINKKPGVIDIISSCKASHNKIKAIKTATSQTSILINL